MIKKHFLRLFAMTALFCALFAFQATASNRLQTTLRYNGTTVAYDQISIELYVNGTRLTNLPMEPVLIGTRTYVPVREVFESMGATVVWNGDLKQVYIAYGNDMLMLELGNRVMKLNSASIEMEVAPIAINDKTMVPVSFVASALQFEVTADWAATHRHVFINAPNTVVPPAGSPAVDISTVALTAAPHPTTTITGVTLPPANTGAAEAYTITAAGPISRVEKILLADNRLILDIYNAEFTGSETAYPVTASPYANGLRAAQNQLVPEKITRVVFDLADSVRYAVALSADRQSINVTLGADVRPTLNPVSDISFVSDGTADILTISGQNSAPAASVFTLTSPNRLVIDLPMSELASTQEFFVNGMFAERVHAVQYDANTARITLNLIADAKYSVTTSGNRTIVTLTAPTYRNIGYDTAKNLIVVNKAQTGLRASDIEHLDEYLQTRYTFTFPGDFTSQLGHGTYAVNNSLVNSFTIQNVNGKTQIVVNGARILAFDVTEDASNIYIRPMLPSEKYSKIVIIDPGHGGGHPGTIANGLVEKDLNLDIALKLIALLEADGRIKVYATRLSDVNPSLAERAIFANGLGDVFVSIHNNAAAGVPNANGTETYYYAHANDAELGLSSKDVAAIMQKHLLNELGSTDRKIKSSALQVLRETTIPAVLVEVGFLTNRAESEKLATAEYRAKAAQALYKGIIEVFDGYTPAR